MSITEILTALAAAIGVLLGAYATLKKANTESRASTATEVDRHFARQDKKIGDLQNDLKDAVRREKVLSDYVYLLRQHIAEENPPPPPPWPPSLLTTD